eukprot:7272787-Prymnesium_polylepis.2
MTQASVDVSASMCTELSCPLHSPRRRRSVVLSTACLRPPPPQCAYPSGPFPRSRPWRRTQGGERRHGVLMASLFTAARA